MTDFTKVSFNLFCKWTNNPPSYRIYVNHEMFNERTYSYAGTQFLQEILQLHAPPGTYKIKIEPLDKGKFWTRDLKSVVGNVKIIDNETFEILPNENT